LNLNLSEKRVLISGASRGIGKSTAIGFLEEGAHIVIASRGIDELNKLNLELKKKYSSSKIFCQKCDFTDERDLKQLKRLVEDKFGGIDIVVANVGDGQSVSDVIPNKEQWNQVWDSNFNSALFTARTFLPMLEISNGNLLFVSSIAGIEAFGAPVDYSSAKAAINALAKNMARKLTNVRVNVVAPGNVYFKGGAWDQKIIKNPGQIEKLIKSTVPMNRFAVPEEIANSILFLCSNRSSFTTGATLVIDGGQTVGVC